VWIPHGDLFDDLPRILRTAIVDENDLIIWSDLLQ